METEIKISDTYSYKGWLNSDKFLKRSFAIMGYYMVASLIITIPIFLFMMVAGVLFYM